MINISNDNIANKLLSIKKIHMLYWSDIPRDNRDTILQS